MRDNQINLPRMAALIPGATLVAGIMIPIFLILQRRTRVRAVIQLVGIRFIGLAGNVTAGVLTAAFLGPEGRGEQAAMLLAATVLTPFCTLGLHASLVYNLRADPEHGSAFFGSAIIMTFAAGCAAAAVGYCLVPLWLEHYGADTVYTARLFLLFVPLNVVTSSFIAALEAHGRFGLANRAVYFSSLGTPVLLCGLAVAGKLTAASSSICYVIPTFPMLLFLAIAALGSLRPVFRLTAPYPRRLLRYGLRFYGVDVLGSVSSYLDQVVIVYLLPPAAVGAYAVALSLSRVLSIAQSAVLTVLFPSVAALDTKVVVETVARAARFTAVLNLGCAIAMGIVAPSLLLLMYGLRFAPAVAPFLVLLAGAVINSTARTLSQAFSGTGRPGMVTAVEVAGVVTSLLAMLIVVPSYGIVGAAACTALGGVLRLCLIMATFRRIVGLTLPHLIISRTDVNWILAR